MCNMIGIFLTASYFVLFKIFVSSSSNTTEIYEVTSSTHISSNSFGYRDALAELYNPHIKVTITELPPKCVQMQCNFVCFYGKSIEIERDIQRTIDATNRDCPIIEELRIYNYDFPDEKIPKHFLGIFQKRVMFLYIASSKVTDVDDGVFAKGIFEQIYFENLQLVSLRKDFFDGISPEFKSLIILQREQPIKWICRDFLYHIKYQIQFLSLQAGIDCIRNLTAADNLLNKLKHVDFSHNNFEDQLVKNSFEKLSVVEYLDLSHSHISFLPDYIFNDFQTRLEYLDLSHNKLVTINKIIFGRRDLPSTLKIIANDNEWECSCDLSKEMKQLMVFQSNPIVCCTTPDQYQGWSVLDDRICEEVVGFASTSTPKYNSIPTTEMSASTTTMTSFAKKTTPHTETTEFVSDKTNHPTTLYPPNGGGSAAPPTPPMPPNSPEAGSIVQLECNTSNTQRDKFYHHIQWPQLLFDIQIKPINPMRAEVKIRAGTLNESFGLMWFNKITKEFQKMETNYNEYGLGCHKTITQSTIVENLLPNVAYTFCLVQQQLSTVSPFSCQSVHIDGNLEVSYNAWLTRGMRTTGISLMVLGIVLFLFIGILIIFIIIKQKPTLLKGSKRVATTKCKRGEIIVLPKDKTLEEFKLKEEMLAKRFSRSILPGSISSNRRFSLESIESNQSYMSANLYEQIPAYLRLNDPSINTLSTKTPSINLTESADNYLAPLTIDSSDASLVIYAEIPSRGKRTSNDPLPEVPQDQPPPLSFCLSECAQKLKDNGQNNCSYIYTITTDSQL